MIEQSEFKKYNGKYIVVQIGTSSKYSFYVGKVDEIKTSYLRLKPFSIRTAVPGNTILSDDYEDLIKSDKETKVALEKIVSIGDLSIVQSTHEPIQKKTFIDLLIHGPDLWG